jgi:hypothetical protein
VRCPIQTLTQFPKPMLACFLSGLASLCAPFRCRKLYAAAPKRDRECHTC